MQRPDADTAAYEGFSLAVRLMYQLYEVEAPASEFERPWKLVQEIANGETTITNPAELSAKFPHLRDLLYDQANAVVEHDREVARRILRGLGQGL